MIRRQNFLPALLILFVVEGCDRPTKPIVNSPASVPSISVTILIDTKAGAQQSIAVDDLPSDSTVADVMRAVDDIVVEIRGEGTMTFVDSIDGVQTGGGEGWLYFINDQWATAGIGTQQLSDGDVVRWSYGSFDAH